MRWFSAISGTIATAAAIVTLTAMYSDQMPVVLAPPLPGVVEEYAEESAEEGPRRLVDEYLPPSEVELSKIDPAISAVLFSGGYTELMSFDSLEAELPDDVVALLIENDVVLVVPSGGQSGEETK